MTDDIMVYPTLSSTVYTPHGYAVCHACRQIYVDDLPFLSISIRCPRPQCGLAVFRVGTLEDAQREISA